MGYVLALNLDEQGDAAVRKIWRALAERGINDLFVRIDVPPHVSLAIYDEIDQSALITAVDEFCAQAQGIGITFAAIGVFPGAGALYLQPKVTPELIHVHAEYHRLTEGLGTSDPHYVPENWLSHCTLGMPLSGADLGRALAEVDELNEGWRPITAELSSAALIAFPDDLSGKPKIETLYSGSLRPSR